MTSRNEKQVQSCYRSWSQNYYENYYGERASYPPVHVSLIKKILKKYRCRSLLDAGCGPASFLRELFRTKLDLYGFDLTKEMVDEAQDVLARSGRGADRIWQGSVLSSKSFQCPSKPSKKYDAVICSGVLPHIEEKNDKKLIVNLKKPVKRRGIVIAEARNELFSLFTVNRYSYDFFLQRLIGSDDLLKKYPRQKKKIQKAFEKLKDNFAMNVPPIRRGSKKNPGYDEILSRSHNPFEMKELFEKVGLEKVTLYFYHYHALPPLLEKEVPEIFRKESLSLENSQDWRGHFMASAFIISGVNP